MSVWKKFQRVGKKAAKFQFTASYSEIRLETNDSQPENIVITWLHRSRHYASQPIKMTLVSSGSNSYSHVWEVPENIEITTTLYKTKKDVKFEEKDWTFQLEDVRNDGSRKRVIAYRNINISQYANFVPTQNNVKINFKLSSKKYKSAILYLTLSSVFLKEGEATDDDMMSVASLMSLPNNPLPVAGGMSDIARLSDLDDLNTSVITEAEDNDVAEGDVKGQITQLCGQIGMLQSSGEDLTNILNTKPTTNSLETSSSNVEPEKISAGTAEWANSSSSPVNNSNEIESNSTTKYNNVLITDVTVTTSNTTVADDNGAESTVKCAQQSPSKDSSTDLLEWCKETTKGYSNVNITNFTTSFRNGLAFCAIIHYFEPSLINFNSLIPSNIKENNRIAFSAAQSLGVQKLLDPSEMAVLKIPDPLSVMTYLHQLRTHFTGADLILTPASLGSDNVNAQISPKVSQKSDSIKFNSFSEQIESSPNESSSNQKEKEEQPVSVTDVYKEDTEKSPDKKGMVAFTLGDKKKSQKSPKKSKTKLASFNTDGSIKAECSLTEKKVKKINMGKLNMFSDGDESNQIPSNGYAQSASSPSPLVYRDNNNPNYSNSSQNSPMYMNQPGSSSPTTMVSMNNSKHQYVVAEQLALEKEQERIDEEANRLEPQLRNAMRNPNISQEHKSILLTKWFDLVNKKNALIRRNMHLQILEKEQNLEHKFLLLQDELRQIISVEDYLKTNDMKRREELLLKDLIEIVNQRNSVVHELDKYEQGIADDMEFAKHNPEHMNLTSRDLVNAKLNDKNCLMM